MRLGRLLPALACAALSLQAQTQPTPKEVQIGESRLSFYGFARGDAVFDDSRPDAAQSPTFILSEDAASENSENLTMHPRLTRLGLNFSGPRIDSMAAQVGGKLEIDFQNGGRESRAIPRYRHAYLTLKWADSSLLIGQTIDLISPLFPAVNNDTLMWNAGNLGDRRMQVRYEWQPRREGLGFSVGGALGLTGAVDNQDLDNDGARDGEASAMPNVQARFGLSIPAAGKRLSLGLWGHINREKVSTPIAGKTRFDGHSLGIDYEIPLGNRLVWKGELWTGEDLADFRGGAGQSVNRGTGEEIESAGGWTELGFDLTTSYSLALGYTVDNPSDDGVPAAGRTKNSAWYLVNRWKLGKPFSVGVDYLNWTTEFQARPDGDDNRLNAYVIYNF